MKFNNGKTLDLKVRISRRVETGYDRPAEITFEFVDDASTAQFFEVTFSAEEWLDLIGRNHTSDVRAKFYPTDIIGLKMENKTYDFRLPPRIAFGEQVEVAQKLVQDILEGTEWVPDLDFRSQDSFFYDEDGLPMARTTIRRWVEKE